MVADPDNSGKYLIKNESDEDMSGTFSLYYDDENGERKKITEWRLDVESGGDSEPVSFTKADNAEKSKKYILVFYGTMGAEKGAVTGRVVELVAGPPPYLFIFASGSPGVVWHIKDNQEVAIYNDAGERIPPPYSMDAAEKALKVTFGPGKYQPWEYVQAGQTGYCFKRPTSCGEQNPSRCVWEEIVKDLKGDHQESRYVLNCADYGSKVVGERIYIMNKIRDEYGNYIDSIHDNEMRYNIDVWGNYGYDILVNNGEKPFIPYAHYQENYYMENNGGDFKENIDWSFEAQTMNTSVSASCSLNYRPWQISGRHYSAYVDVFTHQGRAVMDERSRVFFEARESWEKPPTISINEFDQALSVQYGRSFSGEDRGNEADYDYSYSAFKLLDNNAIKSVLNNFIENSRDQRMTYLFSLEWKH